MLNSVPVLWQAIVWLYVGAAGILALGRRLPNGLRRLAVTALALLALRSLLAAGGRIVFFWEPLNLLRMGPVLQGDGLSLLTGLTLCGVTAALALGLRGPKGTAWHGLLLALLAGGLFTATAANLLGLALGSALLDLALLALALSAPADDARTWWRMAAPGLLSTYLLFLSALRMDTLVGHATLRAEAVPPEALLLVGIAGLLRLMVFPLHPRRLATPHSAATVALPAAVGLYLLARAESLGPVLAGRSWAWLITAGALLAGGLMVWAGSVAARREPPPGGAAQALLPGIVVQQGGYALAFFLLTGAGAPWPLVSLPPVLALLAVWWDSSLAREPVARPAWFARLWEQGGQAAGRWRSALAARFPRLMGPEGSRIARRGMALLPILALLAAAGLPLTAGARVRWPLYAAILHGGSAPRLLVALLADTLLVAGLPLAVAALWRSGVRPGLLAALSLLALALSLVALGVAPGARTGAWGLPPVARPAVSVWGLGLVVALPWLIGVWLARYGERAERALTVLRGVVNLDWLYRAAAWLGQWPAGALYWLGLVGEGDGWWGWALAILALGVAFLAAR